MKLDKNFWLKLARSIIQVCEDNREIVLKRLANQYKEILEKNFNQRLDCKLTMYLMNDKTFIKLDFENCVCLVCVYGFLTTYKWYQYKRSMYGNYQHGSNNKGKIAGGSK